MTWLNNVLASIGFFLISLFGGTPSATEVTPVTYIPPAAHASHESTLTSAITSESRSILNSREQLIRQSSSLGCLDYYKDEQHVYIASCVPSQSDGLCKSGPGRNILPGADPKTFHVLNESDGVVFPDCNYGVNATSVYSGNMQLTGINPKEFRGLGVQGLMKDSSSVYFTGTIDQEYPNQTSTPVVYHTQKITSLTGKDTRVLMIEDGGYSFYLLDTHYVYYFAGLYDVGVGYKYKLVEGADPGTFGLVSDKTISGDRADAHDSKNRYYQGTLVK